MSLETETAMLEFAASLNYLVVFPDKSHKLFKSLRDIEGDICVNASTISKKLVFPLFYKGFPRFAKVEK